MTVNIIETLQGAVATLATGSATITTSLVPTDRIVVLVAKTATAGTPTVTGLGLTWTADSSIASPLDVYVISATGRTGGGTITISGFSNAGDFVVYVLRSTVPVTPHCTAQNTVGASGQTAGTIVSLPSTAALNGSMVLAVESGAATFPEGTSSPGGWTLDRAGSNAGRFIHRATTADVSVALKTTTTGGPFTTAAAVAVYYDDTVPNVPPTVSVPADFSTDEDTPVSIHATAADSDGTIASYAWTVTASSTTPPTLTGASTADVGFTPGVPMTLTLRCTVTDNGGATAFDEITVTVTEVPPAEGLTAELEDGTPIETLISSRLTMSDSWTPYIRATLVVKRTAALDVLNPNVSEPPRIIVTLSQPGFTRTFDLSLQRRVNRSDSTATLELTSDEVRLHEYKRVATDIYIPPTGSLRELVAETLAEVGYEIDPSGPNAAVIPDGTAWNPGQTAWSFINPAIQAAGMRLWCDEFRVFHMNTSPQARSGSIVVDYDGPNLIDYRDDADRDSWFDAVVLTFKWTDVLGDDYVAYDIASVPGFSHPYDEVRVDTPYPGPGAAESLLARFLTRGHTAPFTAISDYRATPGMSVILSTPENGIQGGWITGVTWAGDGTMQIDPRSIEEITEYAWLFDTPGVSWLDVAVGVDWSEDV